ncbi:MAG: nucleotidyltransferase family protein [Candidatus Neomarinimicrobiota bacterium]|jgi:NDP-sugar pyrophosphorylase family protein
MKVLILAAGLGTRLQPLTNDRPKALVKLKGKTFLEHALDKVSAEGCNDIVVNVHHFADQVEVLLNKKYPDHKINISDERQEILGTGGAIKHAQQFLGDEPFLVYNVDVISDIDLKLMLQEFKDSQADVLMAVRDRETVRKLCFDNKRLCGWKNKNTGELKGRDGKEFAFSGIQIIDPVILENMPSGNFSIIEYYVSIADKKKIIAYDHSHGMWMDLGTPERLEEAESIDPIY